MVFDGDYLPSKAETEKLREASRDAARKRGVELLDESNDKMAIDQFVKAIDITPTMASQVIQVLEEYGLPYIVAPYEADAQMVYMEKHGIVDAIISEDSDLLIFGANCLLTKMTDRGELVELNRSNFKNCKEFPGLTNMNSSQLRAMAIFSGCDYSNGIPKIGLKTAYKFIRKYSTAQRALKSIRLDGFSVPIHFDLEFRRADLTFQHQRVFDVKTQQLVMLNDPETEISEPEFDDFIGKDFGDVELTRKISKGLVDPITKLPIQLQQIQCRVRLSRRPVARPTTVSTKVFFLRRYICVLMLTLDANCVVDPRLLQTSHTGSCQTYRSKAYCKGH